MRFKTGDLNGRACYCSFQKNVEKDQTRHENIRSSKEGNKEHDGKVCNGGFKRCCRNSESFEEKNCDEGGY